MLLSKQHQEGNGMCWPLFLCPTPHAAGGDKKISTWIGHMAVKPYKLGSISKQSVYYTYLTFPSSYTVTVNMEHLFRSQWILGTSCLSASGNTWNLLRSCQKLWPCLFIHIMRIKLGIYLTAQCLYGQISVGALKQYLSCHVNNYHPSKFKSGSCEDE